MLVVILVSLVLGQAFAESTSGEDSLKTDSRIQVFLTNERGEPQTTFYFSPGQKTVDEVVFRHAIPTELKGYVSWVFEISEPKESLSYRMAFDGALPFLIHWDGMFDNERGILPGRQYFIRLILIDKERKGISSPFAFFMTAEREENSDAAAERVQVEVAKLFVQLTGSFKVVQAKTQRYSSTLFPNLDGDLGVYWKEDHRFGVRFDVTSNILSGWNYDVDGNNLRYSDFSVSYRYRLSGQPPRRPRLPYVPPFAKGFGSPIPIDPTWYGAPLNLEIGMRIYDTVLAGSQDQLIDTELPSEYRGVAATLHTDFMLGPFRSYWNLEAGQSLFRARITHYGMGGMFVYDRWESISPGVLFQYTLLSGVPDDAIHPSQPSISATMLFTGAVLVFKVS